MVILDVNVIISAFRSDSPHHTLASEYLKEIGAAGEMIGWHPAMTSALIRITTAAKFYNQPSSRSQCYAFLDKFYGLPGATRVSESRSFWPLLTSLLDTYDVSGSAVSDFYWAALAIDNGAALCSADQKFGKIKELRWHNLLDYPA